jgi:putative acetyltransferase
MNNDPLSIRAERPADVAVVFALNAAAFTTQAEAKLVDALRAQCHDAISLVAEQGGDMVGHILFSPMRVETDPECSVMGLAPMAVLPARQHQGIGSALVRAGFDACRQAGVGAVVVLGHPEFYPRFGFKPASVFHLACDYDVPDEVFLAIELQPGYLSGRAGRVHYAQAFDSL